MDGLPRHLLHEILFKIDLRALAMMRCTNKSLQSHTNDPYFESEYFSRIQSGLLCISAFGSRSLCYHHLHGGSRSLKRKNLLSKCHILGVCSGLLLLWIDDSLCVANPVTKRFRYLNYSNQMMRFESDMMRFESDKVVLRPNNRKQLGLAVNQIDRATQSFKIVYIFEMEKNNETKYGFEIYNGNSWKCSKTMFTCHSSDLDYNMKHPVYLHGSLHWLRNDGSILAFNPETEQARLITVKCPQVTSKTLFAAGDDRLTLISATEEVIYVFSLENILSDPKWVLVKEIRAGVMNKERLRYWYVEAYNGKCLVLHEGGDDRVVHVYDLRANKWAVMGSNPAWGDAAQNFFQFTPSPYSVVGLDKILACDDRPISSLSSISALIDGSSSEEVETQLRIKFG